LGNSLGEGVYSLEDLISFFIRRFPKSNLIHIFKSLIYFEDAEKDPEPQLLKTVSWNQVKEKIGKVVLEIDFFQISVEGKS